MLCSALWLQPFNYSGFVYVKQSQYEHMVKLMYKHAKILFLIATLFNFIVGLSWLFAWPQVQGLMQLAPADGSNKLLINICAVLVLTFGYAYYMASRDPDKYRHYIVLGAIGKILVFITAVPVLINGGQGSLIALLAVGDFIFAGFFLNFMRLYPAPSR